MSDENEITMYVQLSGPHGAPVSAEVSPEPVMADHVEISGRSGSDGFEVAFYLDGAVVLSAELTFPQVLGIFVSSLFNTPERRHAMHHTLLGVMNDPMPWISPDQVEVKVDEPEDVSCLVCGRRLFAAVALRGACLDCVPDVKGDE